MKKIILDNNNYEVIKEYKNALNTEELKDKYTDYFYDFDYMLGDYSYDKLRLKGFYDKKNSNCREINDYSKIDDYINNYCSVNCGYYILKKINDK